MTLNAQQAQAVDTLDNSVLVVAGAGTGKTRVLTHRAAKLITSHRARPEEVACVTFTRKAAEEMRERLAGLIGEADAKRVMINTFHGASLEILRMHPHDVGLRSDGFTPLEEDEQLDLLTWVMHQEAGPHATIDRALVRTIHGTIAGWKEKGLMPDEVNDDEAKSSRRGVLARRIYGRYRQALAARNLVDIPDLLLLVVDLLRRDAAARRYWQERLRYILVDELQDANTLQYEWLKLLTGPNGNICGVGDVRQAIYSWRGAKPDLMMKFETMFPGTSVVAITNNYRSTRQIVTLANGVVAGMANFANAELVAMRDGQAVQFDTYPSDVEETNAIADKIKAEIEGGRAPHEIAVLYRTGVPMERMRKALEKRGVAAVVTGGQPFIQVEEVKDLIAYLKLASNPYDTLAFARVVDRPMRGIGARLARLAMDNAVGYGETIHEGMRRVAMDPAEPMPEARRLQMRRMADLLEELSLMENRGKHARDVIQRVLDEVGYRDWKAITDPNRAEVYEDLYRQLQRLAEEHHGRIGEFLGMLLLTDEAPDDRRDKVHLSTMHSSKGLEWEVVFTPLLVEGVAPHFNATRTNPNPDEERRLVHVAWTRAKEKLVLSAPRLVDFMPARPSRYLVEAEFVSPGPPVARRRF